MQHGSGTVRVIKEMNKRDISEKVRLTFSICDWIWFGRDLPPCMQRRRREWYFLISKAAHTCAKRLLVIPIFDFTLIYSVAYQDENNLYMLLEFCSGGELEYHLNQRVWSPLDFDYLMMSQELFEEKDVLIYAAQLSYGLHVTSAHSLVSLLTCRKCTQNITLFIEISNLRTSYWLKKVKDSFFTPRHKFSFRVLSIDRFQHFFQMRDEWMQCRECQSANCWHDALHWFIPHTLIPPSHLSSWDPSRRETLLKCRLVESWRHAVCSRDWICTLFLITISFSFLSVAFHSIVEG